MISKKPSLNLGFAVLACLICYASPSVALMPTVRSTTVLANVLSIVGGLGLFASATMSVVSQHSNSTDLKQPVTHLGGTSTVCLAAGNVLGILVSEMKGAELLERLDEFAAGMTALGFSLDLLHNPKSSWRAQRGHPGFLDCHRLRLRNDAVAGHLHLRLCKRSIECGRHLDIESDYCWRYNSL